jgi:hypothetical protein
MNEQWWWCIDHNAAEQGEGCPPDRRWGPYATKEDAEHWRDRVAERNEEWDAADRDWEGEDE